MKTNTLFIVAFALGTFLLTPVYADSHKGKNDQRYEQRGDEGKTRHKDKKQKQNNQQQKNPRANNKNLHPGQRKQDVKEHRKPRKDVMDHRKQEKQNRPQNRHYSTNRYDDHSKNKYERQSRREHYKHYYTKPRHVDRRHDYRDYRRDNRHYELRHGKRLLMLTPRHRTFRNVYIVRPFGHSYFGYGHFLNDHNAWRWLGFTAITLSLLDMVDEQAQREHEAAQIEATSADVGERIYWDTDDAYGYVEATREGRSSRGLSCREYQHSITVGGETEEAYGTACLQPDGSWKIVD